MTVEFNSFTQKSLNHIANINKYNKVKSNNEVINNKNTIKYKYEKIILGVLWLTLNLH